MNFHEFLFICAIHFKAFMIMQAFCRVQLWHKWWNGINSDVKIGVLDGYNPKAQLSVISHSKGYV